MDEHLKKLNDLAVAAGESRLSSQTDYIHLKYHALPDEIHYPIPVVENFLYALSLFRTRSIENITKAKTLIEKILYFQDKDGNFPVYLHEYPESKDHYLAVQLLTPLYWIYHGFQQILGADLKKKLEISLTKLLKYCLVVHHDKNPPYFIRLRIATAAFAIGKLLNLEDLKLTGEKQLQEFDSIPKEWFEPKYLADIVVSLQMVDPNLSQNFLKGFKEHLYQTWHFGLCSYSGPKMLEYQAGLEPEITLYDLIMGYFSKKFSKRALKSDSCHLLCALIQPINDEFKDFVPLNEWSGQIGIQEFSIRQDEQYSYAFTSQLQEWNPAQNKGFSPFKLIWGDANRLHTLVTEAGNSKAISFSKNGNSLEFLFELSHLPELEDKEKSREVSFYFDLFEKTSVKIEGFTATTFKLGEEVQVEVDGFKFTLKFELEKGQGQFLGHFMRGNRPSQIANKGSQRFAAFDWQLFLRTIRRPQDEECVIKATLTLIPG